MDPKKTFIEYFGSTYQMDRCGVLKEYKSFNVSKETEFRWAREAFDSSVAALEKSDDITYDFVCAKEFALRLKDPELIKILYAKFNSFAVKGDYQKVMQSLGAVTDMLDMAGRRNVLERGELTVMAAGTLVMLESFRLANPAREFFEENGGMSLLNNCIANLKNIGV